MWIHKFIKDYVSNLYYLKILRKNNYMDFYQKINQQWLQDTVIPDDYQRWSSFEELHNNTQKNVRSIVEKNNTSLYGFLYQTGMDIEKRNKNGLTPLLSYLSSLLNKSNKSFHMSFNHKYGVSMPIMRYVSSDSKNSQMNVVHICQGGLGLPDRDYYFSEDKSDQQEAYKNYLRNIFTYLREKDNSIIKTKHIDQIVDDVYLVEKTLASHQLTRTDRRDPIKTYNSFTLSTLNENFDMIDWENLLDNSVPEKLIIESPEYITNSGVYLASLDKDTWNYYIIARVFQSFTGYLDDTSYQHYFNYMKVLTGQKEPKPLWKRVLSTVETLLGELISRDYVDIYFPPSSKTQMIKLVDNLIESYRDRLRKVDWMGSDTKKSALKKLDRIGVKIGYPDKWRDYSQLSLDNIENYLDQYLQTHLFEFQYEWDQMDKPVDCSKWEMNAHEINAYYHPTQHEIVFPAGILQSPFFDPSLNEAVNYGGIGAVIGHEITHGFDDQGRQYDLDGNLNDWWTKEDTTEFKRLTQKLVEQYNKYVVEDTHLNGELTLGENIADLGGLTISYYAWKSVNSSDKGDSKDFFNSWAKIWRNLIRPQEAKRLVVIDPHSPGKYRVNGVVRNMPEYYNAFGMDVPSDCIKIW